MKIMIKATAVLLLILMLAAAFAACSDGNTDQNAADKADASGDSNSSVKGVPVDYGWVKFNMPDGWKLKKTEDYAVFIEETGNSERRISILKDNTVNTCEDLVNRDVKLGRTRTEDLTFGSYTWTPVRDELDGKKLVHLYTGLGGDNVAYIQPWWGITEDDPAMQTILNSISFDTDQF